MQALSPLDGRYASKVDALRPYFSEEALMRARIYVEISYFAALADEKGIRELKPLLKREKKALQDIVDTFGDREADKIRAIEKVTNHDVKAVEYYLRGQLEKMNGAKAKTEFIHFALTSEDVNNLAYGVLVHDAIKRVLKPELQATIAALRSFEHALNGIVHQHAVRQIVHVFAGKREVNELGLGLGAVHFFQLSAQVVLHRLHVVVGDFFNRTDLVCLTVAEGIDNVLQRLLLALQ
jgi:hypothetical protein